MENINLIIKKESILLVLQPYIGLMFLFENPILN